MRQEKTHAEVILCGSFASGLFLTDKGGGLFKWRRHRCHGRKRYIPQTNSDVPYEAADGTKLATDGLPGIIKTIDEYLSHRQERELKSDIFTTYKDSLQIKDPEDILLLLKQVSENKDVAK